MSLSHQRDLACLTINNVFQYLARKILITWEMIMLCDFRVFKQLGRNSNCYFFVVISVFTPSRRPQTSFPGKFTSRLQWYNIAREVRNEPWLRFLRSPPSIFVAHFRVMMHWGSSESSHEVMKLFYTASSLLCSDPCSVGKNIKQVSVWVWMWNANLE